ncbi:50S ribosomal protein L22 [Candidatus Woesearchaeota archaeon]|nr:50S ribosomal protein L22 [Candidatus Woesearchaeota archaeon]
MTTYKYSAEEKETEHSAKAVGRSLPISTKQSVEICNLLRKKELNKAKKLLKSVISMKQAVPYKRYNKDVGHKRSVPASGRFPVKASKEILSLLNSVESNAQFKGLNTSSLIISHISAQKTGTSWHYGRKSRRKMKRTNIEIIVKEGQPSKPKKQKAPAKKPAEKKEDKKEAPKAEKKEQPAETKKETPKKQEKVSAEKQKKTKDENNKR